MPTPRFFAVILFPLLLVLPLNSLVEAVEEAVSKIIIHSSQANDFQKAYKIFEDKIEDKTQKHFL